jgi:uncharacterized membrane protein YbhN (UPF0104 family)
MTKSLLLGLKIIVSSVLLWLALRHADFSHLVAQTTASSLLPLTASALLVVAALVLVSWRWQILLAIAGSTFALPRLLSHAFVGLFFSQVLPSTIGGDGMRAWLVYRDGAPASTAVRSVIIERAIGLVVLAALAGVGAPRLSRGLGINLDAWVVGAAAVTGLVVGLVMLKVVERLGGASHLRLGRGLHALARDTLTLLGRPAQASLFAILSFAGHLLGCATIWLLGRAVGAPISLVDVIIVMPTVFILAALPISIAGWGVREGAMVVGLGFLGVSQGDAVAVSVAFGLVSIVVALIGGIIWVLQPAPARMSRISPGAMQPMLGENPPTIS